MLKAHRGYTLVEMLMATVLTLMIMGAVAQLFESVGKGITRSRSLLEVSDRLRLSAARLQLDLAGVTTTMQPPREPARSEGYFEYTEGPIGALVRPEAVFRNADADSADTTVIDNDDILMFTAHSSEPFVGRYRQPVRNAQGQITSYANTTVQSHDAEIAWFVRGRTLYRRVLLIVPNLDLGDNRRSGAPDALAQFYAYNDISMRAVFDNNGNLMPWANSLSDLTRPEYRFAHQPRHRDASGTVLTPAAGAISRFPYHPHFGAYWNRLSAAPGDPPDMPPPPYVPRGLTNTGAPTAGLGGSRAWRALGLPTLQECCSVNWPAGQQLPDVTLTRQGAIDLWTNPHFWSEIDPDSGTLAAYADNLTRINEDVILSNVIGFDVKAWDAGAPAVRLTRPSPLPPPDDPQEAVVTCGDAGYLYALWASAQGQPYNGIRYWQVNNFGGYVDLNYMAPLGTAGGVQFPDPYNWGGSFFGAGHWRSGTRGAEPFGKVNRQNLFDRSADVIDPDTGWIAAARDRDSVYDTWSTHYENDVILQFPVEVSQLRSDHTDNIFSGERVGDLYGNGQDDWMPNTDPTAGNPDPWIPSAGAIDDDEERDTRPPYTAQLRGVQVTIRAYEPGTNQIRQRTIRWDF